MGFLDTLSSIGGAAASVGSVTGAVHGVVGLLSGDNSSAKSKELMDYQAAVNEAAAQRSYMRQRQFTADQYSLTKLGKRQAGMNTAQGDGSVAAASVNPENSVSPTVLPTDASVDSQYQQMMSNSASLISNLGLQRAQVALLQSQKANQDIKNINQLAKDQSEIENLKENSNKTMLEAAHQSLVNKYADSRLSAEAEEANSRALMASQDAAVHGQMNEIDYQNKVANLNLLKAEGKLTAQQYYTELAKLDVMRSQVASNYASANASNSQASLNRSQVDLNRVEYYVNNATKDDVIRAAQLAVAEHGPQSISDWSWKVFNNWDNESDGAKTGAVFALIPQILGQSIGGGVNAASSSFGTEKGKQFATKKPNKIGFH